MISFELAVLLSAIVLGAGVAISSLEQLAVFQEYAPGGLLDGRVLSLLEPRHSPIARILLSSASVKILLQVRVALALALISSPYFDPAFVSPLSLILFLTQLALSSRSGFGDDGADQMTLVALAGLSVAGLHNADRDLALLGAYFIAAQATLAYFASGIAKSASKIWRAGSGLPRVLSNATYGSEKLARLVPDGSLQGKVLCWSVMALQLTFPIIWFLPSEGVFLYLAGVGSFHIGVALIMRLNTFVPPFLATYPLLLAVHPAQL